MNKHVVSSMMVALLTPVASFASSGCSGDSSDPSSSSAGGQAGAGGQGGPGGQGGSGGQGAAGGAAGQGQGGQGGGSLCADRMQGALVTFDIAGESLTLWITNSAFIDEAIALKQSGMTRVPVFEQVIDGADCDSQWSWHVDPALASFADFTIELCDGTPSYLEAHTAEWIASVKSYCPWSAAVTAVDDRRP